MKPENESGGVISPWTGRGRSDPATCLYMFVPVEKNISAICADLGIFGVRAKRWCMSAAHFYCVDVCVCVRAYICART